MPGPALPERMKPLVDRACEGRVNPKGIPCLYMASDEHTAMAEVRPWIGSLVSVAVFRSTRALRIVDCTKDAERLPLYLDGEPPAQQRAEAVWAHIAHAFKEPVTRNDDVAEYAATQIIAEMFRAMGLDGVAYRSAFGLDRYNVALFDVKAAELCMCSLHEIKDVELKYCEAGNPYYVRKNVDGGPTLVRNEIVRIRGIKE
jgi:RES domain-containing protein